MKRIGCWLLCAVALAGTHIGRAGAESRARNLVVISIPNVTWDDVAAAHLPHLDALFAQSGVADMSLHGVNYKPTLADGYLTINTGARSEAKGATIDALRSHNDHLLYDARVGLLGDTLARHGFARVVAGSDAARLALIDHAGQLGNASSTAPIVELVEARTLTEADGVVARTQSQFDAVLVVSPSEPPGPFRTTIAALKAPGLQPGLMRSAYTRREGTVALVDVAPTILNVLGIARPDHMEGRAFEFARADGDYGARVHWLRETNTRARFRDSAITQVGGVFVGGMFVLTALALLLRARPRQPFVIFALAWLFFLPATYLAVLFPFAHWGLPAYWAFVVGVSVAAAIGASLIGARTAIDPLLFALSVIVALILIDVLTGARLQFNGAFGYSPTIGGRFAGLGNLGYAQLAAAVVLLAALWTFRFPQQRWFAIALLALAIIVDGAPFWGADVGGVLSMVPAFAMTTVLLLGWRVRTRVVVVALLAGVALLGIFAAIDLARPADSRSHLGRLLGGGGGDFWLIIHRKLAENLSVLSANPFAFLLPIVYIAAAYYVYRSPGALRAVRDKIPTLSAGLIGLGVVALLGTLLNDSGVAITGVMFGVMVPTLVVLEARCT